MIIALVIIGWITCGVLNYGMALESFTRKFPYMKHTGFAVFSGFTGPFGLIVELFASNRRLLFRPYSVEKRWEIFRKEHEILGRNYFDRKHS